MQVFIKVLIIVNVAVQCIARDWSEIYPRYPKINVPRDFQSKKLNNERIVGGNIAEPHSFPHQVALFIHVEDKAYFCGGSLISSRYVLTAAHCAIDAESIEVVLGAHNIRDPSESTQIRIKAESYLVHEGFDQELLNNDIALVRLPENSFEFSDIIKAVTLPRISDISKDFLDENSIISGWGKISDTETTYTDILQYVEAPIITNEECKIWYFGLFIEDSNICASGFDGKSPCNGDSGGALIIDGKQVGIASFGVSFGCEIDFPGAYTRVTSYLDWIEEHSDVEIEP